MKAVIKTGLGATNVGLKDIQEPQAAKNEIKIKVHAAGICGTDLHILHDEFSCNFPVVMGHEYSGTVCEIGSDVTDFNIGDRVVSLTAAVTCGKCKYCHDGLLMLCDKRLSIGSGVNGAFAEYLTIPAKLAFKIPANVTLDEAALCEPLACVIRGVVEMSSVKPGDYVYVSGPGPIGLLTMQVAKASGAIVAVAGTQIDKERLLMAERLGADITINVNEEDVFDRSNMITKGCGFDVAFECAGVAPSADTCLKVLKKTGILSQVALFGKKIVFDFDLALKKEVRLTNSFASERSSWERALRMLSQKRVDISPLISAKLPLHMWERAFDMAIKKEGYKILFVPDETEYPSNN